MRGSHWFRSAAPMVAGIAAVAMAMGPAAGQGPTVSPSAATEGVSGTPGARSAGDPFYPTLGNGGYDVERYDLRLAWTPDADGRSGVIDGDVTIQARASQELSELSLDLTRTNTALDQVRLNGLPVSVGSDVAGRKLLIDPLVSLRAGAEFTLRIRYRAVPGLVSRLGEELPFEAIGDAASAQRATGRGFIVDGVGGFLLAAQPNGAHTLIPSNDHPTDKALMSVRLTVPRGMVGIATGELIGLTPLLDGSTVWEYRSSEPVATHVLSAAVGRYALLYDTGPHQLPLRHAVPPALAGVARPLLEPLPEALSWLEARLGPYPFGTFGLQLYPAGATVATLEAQTFVLASARLLNPLVSTCDRMSTLVHEAAHQWLGNAVSIVGWNEKWLSEGHATYYEREWRAEQGCEGVSLDALMESEYRSSQRVRDTGGPPARPREPRFQYDATIYGQGALALYALRQEVGVGVFETIERELVGRFGGESASTRDLIDLASEVAARDLDGFLRAWLCDPTVPPMPGRPDWATDASAAVVVPPVAVGRQTRDAC